MSENETVMSAKQVLFLCEGRPVYAGDRLHVAPRCHVRAGAQVLAYREAVDGVAVCRSIPSNAVPAIQIADLSWNPFQETLDREYIAKQMPGGSRNKITERDLMMWRLGVAARVSLPEPDPESDLSYQPDGAHP